MNERIHDEPPPFAKKHFSPLFRVRTWDDDGLAWDETFEDRAEALDFFEPCKQNVRDGLCTAAQLSENGMILHRISNAPRAPSTAAFLGQREEAE